MPPPTSLYGALWNTLEQDPAFTWLTIPIPHTGIIVIYDTVALPLFNLHPAQCVALPPWTPARRPDASSGQFCSAWLILTAICLALPRPSGMMGEGRGILDLEMADYVLTGSRSKLQAVFTEWGIKEEREGGRYSPTIDGWWLLLSRWGRGNGALTAVTQPWTLHVRRG